MKAIHILLGKANPNTMNGVNVVVHNLVSAQLKQDIDAEVWGITHSPQKVHHDHNYELKLFQKKRFGFSLDENLKEKIKNIQKDTLVHLHSAFIPELYSISKLLTQLKIPYIVTPHGAFDKSTMDNKKFKKYLYFNVIERKILNNAGYIHFIGKSEMEHVRSLGITTNSILIPNGTVNIDTEALNCKKNENKIIFTYCGRIAIHHKGLDLLLEAFINYKSSGGKGILQFIGDGVDLNTLVQLAKASDYVDDIQFLGKIFGEEKLNILCSSDVFLHTSRHDVLPTATLKAAALSLPLLISKETNLDGYVEKYKAGKVLEINNIKNIEKSLFEMEELYNKGELQAYGVNAKKMIDEELNWNKIAQTFISCYKNILSEVYE